jgi:quinol monooxygenase YgiN
MIDAPNDREVRMRTVAVIEHRVADFDAWKAVYDGVRPMQQAGGVRSHRVMQDPADPNLVYVTHVFDTRETADAFFANPELKAGMEQAGVDASSLSLSFFDEVESGDL